MTTAAPKLTTLRRSLALAGAFAALAVTTVSFAAPRTDDSPSITVRYSDLDLTTAAGANALYHRIANAASEVCPDPRTRNLGILEARKRCQQDAIARAVQAVNNPQLALVHAAHTYRTSHG